MAKYLTKDGGCVVEAWRWDDPKITLDANVGKVSLMSGERSSSPASDWLRTKERKWGNTWLVRGLTEGGFEVYDTIDDKTFKRCYNPDPVSKRTPIGMPSLK